jgi:hypothetical protein
MVGGYAMVKGEVSEKLALRRGAALPSVHDIARKPRPGLPRGLDDPRWDFSPKEESDAPRRSGAFVALGRVVARWAEAMGWVLAPLAFWGALRVRSSSGRWLIATYVILFAVVLVRHAMTLGYLSDRHTLTMAVATLPWASAGMLACARRVVSSIGRVACPRLRGHGIGGIGPPEHAHEDVGMPPEIVSERRWGIVGLAALIVVGAAIQAKPAHASRWGHQAAGRWLIEHSDPSDAILDTRGWAAFLAERPSYDPWHVRQALTDAHLRYIVVGADELGARSRRAATLRALLAFAAEPVAEFPGRRAGGGVAVRVFRFRRPESWEGLRP